MVTFFSAFNGMDDGAVEEALFAAPHGGPMLSGDPEYRSVQRMLTEGLDILGLLEQANIQERSGSGSPRLRKFSIILPIWTMPKAAAFRKKRFSPCLSPPSAAAKGAHRCDLVLTTTELYAWLQRVCISKFTLRQVWQRTEDTLLPNAPEVPYWARLQALLKKHGIQTEIQEADGIPAP